MPADQASSNKCCSFDVCAAVRLSLCLPVCLPVSLYACLLNLAAGCWRLYATLVAPVSLVPEHDFWGAEAQRVHLGAFNDKYNYQLSYPTMFGGVTGFKPEQFEKVNGFSNRYFGWGGEDDDMYLRITDAPLEIIRNPREVARYKVIPHERDQGNIQPDRRAMLHRLEQDRYSDSDGLNTLQYVFRDRRLYPLYTWLLVDIGPVRLEE